MTDLDSLLRALRRRLPLKHPIRVVVKSMPENHGLYTDPTVSGQHLIELDHSSDFWRKSETFTHEYAHALHWEAGDKCCHDGYHCDHWGAHYAQCYRIYERWLSRTRKNPLNRSSGG